MEQHFFSTLFIMTQLSCRGSYWLSSCRGEIWNALFCTAWRQEHLPYPNFRPTSAPPKSPCDGSWHKVVLGCMRRAHFLLPPLALLNHLVRGAQTMACMALKGHYNIALSTFTATKLNRPCLRGRIKLSTALMSCRPQIWLDSAGRFVTIELCFGTASLMRSNSSLYKWITIQ